MLPISRISSAQLAQLHLLLSSLLVLPAPLKPHQRPAQSWALLLLVLHKHKVNGAVVSYEALSIPNMSGVHQTFVLEKPFTGVLQSCILDVIVLTSYLPPLWGLLELFSKARMQPLTALGS